MKKMIATVICVSLLAQWGAMAADYKTSTPELIKKGKAAYTTNCMTCHGEKGDGQGPAGVALKPAPRNFAKDPFKKGDKTEQIVETITKGLPGTTMVPYGHLPEADRWAIAHYIQTFRPAKK